MEVHNPFQGAGRVGHDGEHPKAGKPAGEPGGFSVVPERPRPALSNWDLSWPRCGRAGAYNLPPVQSKSNDAVGAVSQMGKNLEDQSAERMLERYREGLLTKEELDDFLEIQRRRSEIRERAIEAGRLPGRAREEA